MHKEVIDGAADATLWPRGKKDELDSQQRDEDEGGPHRLHVGCALSAVGVFQLGDQDPDNIQEKEEVHLWRRMSDRYLNLLMYIQNLTGLNCTERKVQPCILAEELQQLA